MNRIAIIAVSYNRPDSLSRLLSTIKIATYDNDKVDLIISIDKSDAENELVTLAENFDWDYGEKKIRTFESRQGLRSHILQCGDFTDEYEAVIIFEDDIIAASDFYLFTKNALNYYADDSRIAGISLYSPIINEMVERPFTAMRTNSDVYFIQSAQSWGQCWSKEMWKSFREWYASNNSELLFNTDMPARIYSWPESSWKKYFMKYLVETNKYFVYPYESLSTNASDVGQHVKKLNSRSQVPMLIGNKEYIFTSLEDGIKYDIFFEREGLAKYLANNIEENELCVDIYGSKLSNKDKRYILTRKKMNFEILSSYALMCRPHEINIVFQYMGNDIFLYDLKESRNSRVEGKIDKKTELEYYSSLSWKPSLLYGLLGFKDALIYKLFKR